MCSQCSFLYLFCCQCGRHVAAVVQTFGSRTYHVFLMFTSCMYFALPMYTSCTCYLALIVTFCTCYAVSMSPCACCAQDIHFASYDSRCLFQPAPRTDTGLMSLLPTFILCLGFGLSAHLAPYYFIDAADGFGMTAAGGLALGTISIHLAAIGAPWMLQRYAQ